MSNQAVGSVYQSIIEEVINSSRIDFEEAGVNVSTLDDLKQVWHGKLSDLKIAHFPWDPPPPETSSTHIANGTTGRVVQQPQQHQHLQATKPDSNGAQYQNGGVKIKTEPGLEPWSPGNLTGNPTHDPELAAMRAQQNIAQKFGLQSRPAGGLVLPGMNPSQQAPQLPRPANAQHHNGIPQHDGAGDCDDEMIPIEGFRSLSRTEADKILLNRIGQAERKRAKVTEEISQALQNLGASTTNNKEKSKGKGKARRSRRLDAYEETLNPNSNYPYGSLSPSFKAPGSTHGIAQLDGDLDDDTPDEDAINSDLDDPEDDEIDNDDDEEVPQIMLCMYDKVQRTKNKWKCVLKDGVLTINGQEYVFHKANGEYEW